MKNKKRLISLLFLVLAILVGALNLYISNSTKSVIEITVLKNDVKRGTLITNDMLTTKEIGQFNQNNVITDKGEVVGKYANIDIKASRNLYNDYFSTNSNLLDIEQKILNKAVAVNTNLVSSVAAEIKENSIVKIALIKKLQDGSAEIIYPEALSKVRVLKIAMDSGQEINQENNSEIKVTNDEVKRPAVIVLDLTDEQTKLILPYSYSGNIHCFLLNSDEADEFREKIGV